MHKKENLNRSHKRRRTANDFECPTCKAAPGEGCHKARPWEPCQERMALAGWF